MYDEACIRLGVTEEVAAQLAPTLARRITSQTQTRVPVIQMIGQQPNDSVEMLSGQVIMMIVRG